MTQPRQDLPAARRRLEIAVSALIEPKPVTVHRDDDTTQITWLDSLFAQLLDAVSGQTGERSGGPSSTPVWADVLDLLKVIDKQVAKWHPEWPIPDISDDNPTPTTIARLQAIQARKWRVEDTDHVNDVASQIDVWVEAIHGKLNPEPVIYLMAPAPARGPAPCPACGKDYVWRPDASDNGKPKRQPVLKITGSAGCVECRCQACQYTWDAYHLRMLAGAVGYPLPAGVLE